MALIPINDNLALDEEDLQFSFILASGPGGQKVNKTSTAVQLRFDVCRCEFLSTEVREHLLRLAGSRVTEQGEIVITARNQRTQLRNRQEAIERLVQLIRKALVVKKPRKKTRPSKAARQRRLEGKKKQGQKKELRRRVKV